MVTTWMEKIVLLIALHKHMLILPLIPVHPVLIYVLSVLLGKFVMFANLVLTLIKGNVSVFVLARHHMNINRHTVAIVSKATAYFAMMISSVFCARVLISSLKASVYLNVLMVMKLTLLLPLNA